MTEVEISTTRARPILIDAATHSGRTRLIALVEGVGVQYRVYYDVHEQVFLVVMWPFVGNKNEMTKYLNAEQEIAMIPVTSGAGGYARSWIIALRSATDQAMDEMLHQAFVGVIAPQN